MITQEEVKSLEAMAEILMNHLRKDRGSDYLTKATPAFVRLVSVIKNRAGNPTAVEHNWLASALQGFRGIRHEMRPGIILGQGQGIFDVQLNDYTWARVGVTEFALTQAVLRGDEQRR